MAEQSINIPQLIAVALVGFFALRWFLKPAPPSSDSSSSSSRNRVDVVKVDQIASMFPQLDRRTIAWDLQRNGGNVSATTERVLANRPLDVPPPSFQPQLPSPAQTTSGTPSGRPAARAGHGAQPDLITKYGLQGRIGGKGKQAEPSAEQLQQAWSSDKAKRAEGLKRRREEMILAARRKMEARTAEAS